MPDQLFYQYARGFLKIKDLNYIFPQDIVNLAYSFDAKNITALFDAGQKDGGIECGPFFFEGNMVKNLLGEKTKVLVGVFTLGLQTDTLVREWTKKDIEKSVILNACLAAKLERDLDIFFDNLAKDYSREGKTVTRRISPGYEDLPLSAHSEIVKKLSADKYLGIYPDVLGMVRPEKTVTCLVAIG